MPPKNKSNSVVVPKPSAKGKASKVQQDSAAAPDPKATTKKPTPAPKTSKKPIPKPSATAQEEVIAPAANKKKNTPQGNKPTAVNADAAVPATNKKKKAGEGTNPAPKGKSGRRAPRPPSETDEESIPLEGQDENHNNLADEMFQENEEFNEGNDEFDEEDEESDEEQDEGGPVFRNHFKKHKPANLTYAEFAAIFSYRGHTVSSCLSTVRQVCYESAEEIEKDDPNFNEDPVKSGVVHACSQIATLTAALGNVLPKAILDACVSEPMPSVLQTLPREDQQNNGGQQSYNEETDDNGFGEGDDEEEYDEEDNFDPDQLPSEKNATPVLNLLTKIVMDGVAAGRGDSRESGQGFIKNLPSDVQVKATQLLSALLELLEQHKSTPHHPSAKASYGPGYDDSFLIETDGTVSKCPALLADYFLDPETMEIKGLWKQMLKNENGPAGEASHKLRVFVSAHYDFGRAVVTSTIAVTTFDDCIFKGVKVVEVLYYLTISARNASHGGSNAAISHSLDGIQTSFLDDHVQGDFDKLTSIVTIKNADNLNQLAALFLKFMKLSNQQLTKFEELRRDVGFSLQEPDFKQIVFFGLRLRNDLKTLDIQNESVSSKAAKVSPSVFASLRNATTSWFDSCVFRTNSHEKLKTAIHNYPSQAVRSALVVPDLGSQTQQVDQSQRSGGFQRGRGGGGSTFEREAGFQHEDSRSYRSGGRGGGFPGAGRGGGGGRGGLGRDFGKAGGNSNAAAPGVKSTEALVKCNLLDANNGQSAGSTRIPVPVAYHHRRKEGVHGGNANKMALFFRNVPLTARSYRGNSWALKPGCIPCLLNDEANCHHKEEECPNFKVTVIPGKPPHHRPSAKFTRA